jgi:hypothetical protein
LNSTAPSVATLGAYVSRENAVRRRARPPPTGAAHSSTVPDTVANVTYTVPPSGVNAIDP